MKYNLTNIEEKYIKNYEKSKKLLRELRRFLHVGLHMTIDI